MLPNEKDRIQKILAAGGEYSRRQIERLITEGKIKVNGIVVRQKGIKVDPRHDRINVAGKAFRYQPEEKTYLLFNKPRKVVAARSDPDGRRTVYDFLPAKMHHLKPVGRLDYNTQGALILTNDGDMILKLTHPRYQLPKVYEVKITQKPDEKQLRRLRQGIVLDGTRSMPVEIRVTRHHESSFLLQIRMLAGNNRQVRQMLATVGIIIKELRCVAIGPLELGSLRSGQFRFLTPAELRRLERLAD